MQPTSHAEQVVAPGPVPASDPPMELGEAKRVLARSWLFPGLGAWRLDQRTLALGYVLSTAVLLAGGALFPREVFRVPYYTSSVGIIWIGSAYYTLSVVGRRLGIWRGGFLGPGGWIGLLPGGGAIARRDHALGALLLILVAMTASVVLALAPDQWMWIGVAWLFSWYAADVTYVMTGAQAPPRAPRT